MHKAEAALRSPAKIFPVVAAAVEEQKATTNKIMLHVDKAVAGSAEIARNISSVASAALGTTRRAQDNQRAERILARMAVQFKEGRSEVKI
jgi:methyl-accepting chemotaxis protein